MFLLVLIMILILTIIYFLVGLLIARLALLWLAWLFSTTKNSSLSICNRLHPPPQKSDR